MFVTYLNLDVLVSFTILLQLLRESLYVCM